jgi:hypothetical protein
MGIPGRVAAINAFALAILLGTGTASARPHELPKWKDPNGPPVEMEVWLKRLVGRYEFDGLVHVIAQGDCGTLPPDPAESENPPPVPPPACEPVKGRGDCVGIGSGPGVQCIFNIQWRDIYAMDFEEGSASAAPGAAAYLDPSMALFGMDPVRAAISYMLVDKKGLPEGGTGVNTGKRAVFKTPCVNVEVLTACHRTLSIEADADANLLYMRVDIRNDISGDPITSITMSMRRVRSPEPVAVGQTGQPGQMAPAAPAPGNRRRF